MQMLLFRNIHENAVEILLPVRLVKELGLDGDPSHPPVLANQPILIVYRIPML